MNQLRSLLLSTIAAAFPVILAAQDSLFIKESLAKWQNATAYTLEVARAMPSDKFGFKPVDEEMTFAAQLDHIGQNMTWLAGDYLKGVKFEHPLQNKKERSPEETIELLAASLAFAEETLAKTDPDSLGIVKDFFAGPMSRRQIIALMHDHHTHHRGQIIVYLRMNGVKPPKYRGW